MSAETLLETLGGPRLLKRRARSLDDLHKLIQSGFPFGIYSHLVQLSALTAEEAEHVFQIPSRTLVRRKGQHRFLPDESDRLYRFANVLAKATEVLGSAEKARHWLHQPNRALNLATPLNLLSTTAGTARVETLLGRLEYGVYS